MATVPLFVLQNNPRVIRRKRTVLEQLSDFEIRKHCGLDFHGICDILELFDPLQGKKRFAVPVETKVFTFLSYLRSGNFQYSLGTLSGTSQPTVSRIIEECTSHVISFARDYIKFPTAVPEVNASKLKFASLSRTHGFPNILGVIDGTHVPIIAPFEDEDSYVNRKHFHSVNCQVVVNADQKFLDVNAKWPGGNNDAFIWRESSVKRRLSRGELGEGWFIGKRSNYLLLYFQLL